MARIAVITEESRMGGPQQRILRLLPRLRRKGLDPVVVRSCFRSEEFARRLTEAEIPQIPLPLHPLTRAPLWLLRYILFLPVEIALLWWRLRTGGYDLVFINGGSWQFKGVLAARLCGIPVLWHLNDTRTPSAVMKVFRLVAPLAAGFVANGERVRAFYLDGHLRPDQTACVIQSGVDTRVFHPREPRMRHTPPEVLLVGNVNPIKGIETFMDAAALLRDRGVQASFSVVGPVLDSQRTYFAELCKRVQELGLDNFQFRGPSCDIPDILAEAEVFVLASRHEASPNALWEAMASGLPVVSTDVADVRKLTESADAALIVAVDDAQGMAKAVATLLEQPDTAERMGRSARSVAEQYLDADRITEQYHAVFLAHARNN